MFGRNKVTQRLQQVEDRITHNSEILEEDHAYLIELKTQMASLLKENEELRSRIEALEARQSNLRGGMRQALEMITPIQPPELWVDHVCVNEDGQPSVSAACVYCNRS